MADTSVIAVWQKHLETEVRNRLGEVAEEAVRSVIKDLRQQFPGLILDGDAAAANAKAKAETYGTTISEKITSTLTKRLEEVQSDLRACDSPAAAEAALDRLLPKSPALVSLKGISGNLWQDLFSVYREGDTKVQSLIGEFLANLAQSLAVERYIGRDEALDIELMAALNQAMGPSIADLLTWYQEHQPKQLEKKRGRRPGVQSLEEYLFQSDNINAAAVSFFSRASQCAPMDGLAYGLEQRYKYHSSTITFGLPSGEKVDDLFDLLCKGGPQMVKAHFALWGRWYEDGGAPGGYLTVHINQFCADIGYKPHKRAFRREDKIRAMELLEAITSVEMRVTFTPSASKGTQRLRGHLWARGLLAEEDQYGDLFGHAREGHPEDWEPVSFSFAPGPWLSHPEWSHYNRAIGKMGAGLMQLRNDRDAYAILIGGYIATMLRVERYRTRRLRVETILARPGLAQTDEARRRASENQNKFERAMNRLVEVNSLSSWRYTDEPQDLDEEADADAIAAYYADSPASPNDWRRRTIEITCSLADDAARLQTARTKRIKANQGIAKGEEHQRKQSQNSAVTKGVTPTK